MPPLAYYFRKGHNLITTKVTLPTFVLDLTSVVISIVYKFHKICLRPLVFSFELFYIVILRPFIADYAVWALLIVEGRTVTYCC